MFAAAAMVSAPPRQQEAQRTATLPFERGCSMQATAPPRGDLADGLGEVERAHELVRPQCRSSRSCRNGRGSGASASSPHSRKRSTFAFDLGD